MKSEIGQSSFAVLLFQDIAVIPMLALMPLLAMQGTSFVDNGHGSSLQGWQYALQVAAVVVGIILAGRFLIRPLFRIIANTRMREIFTATALLLVIGIALLMDSVGLSAALGTFLAGVVLAESEYRHELEAEIEPFKGLLLGLFFISVGASINFGLLIEQPVLISSLLFGLLLTKLSVLFILSRIFKIDAGCSWFFAFALSQSGEFCFVLFSFAGQNNILGSDIISPMIVVVALSMAITPVLMIINDKIIQPLYSADDAESQQADKIDDGDTPVILAGMGRFGQIVSRLLIMKGFQVTILEHDASQIELVRKYGSKAFYGDASRLDLLKAAGAETARLLIIAVDDAEKTQQIVVNARKHYPHLKILVRAVGRFEVHELETAGADIIVRETFHSALRMGEHALSELGLTLEEANRVATIFRCQDQKNLKSLAEVYGDEQKYISRSQKNLQALMAVLQADQEEKVHLDDCDWKESENTEN